MCVNEQMGTNINIYCDESCHLLGDKEKKMFMGAVWCPTDKSREISERIYALKEKHKVGHNVELKWTKVSDNKIDFYLDIVDYFFDDDDLHFRGLVVADKAALNHQAYSQTHDDWYYKMYFNLIKVILDPQNKYRIYLDIKDTNSSLKVAHLHQVLSNSLYDFDKRIVERVQTIRSHESALMQIADILLGALSHYNRGHKVSKAKSRVIEKIKQRSKKSLTSPTLLRESKFNLFFWDSKSPSKTF